MKDSQKSINCKSISVSEITANSFHFHSETRWALAVEFIIANRVQKQKREIESKH